VIRIPPSPPQYCDLLKFANFLREEKRLDDYGRPIFLMRTLSMHTQNSFSAVVRSDARSGSVGPILIQCSCSSQEEMRPKLNASCSLRSIRRKNFSYTALCLVKTSCTPRMNDFETVPCQVVR
jgi:hypothetical protein